MSEKLLPILTEVRPDADFGASADFIADGLLDSFDIVALVTALEERFGVAIPGANILPENFRSMEAIAGLVSRSPQRR